ncbi:hypothetical protein ACEPUQ_28720 [Pseudomonas aeruginosa]|nr:hypothetical protein [Pseudomonas aeruginosa]
MSESTEIEVPDVVAFLMKPDTYEPYVGLRRDGKCDCVEPLMTVAQHERILRKALSVKNVRLPEGWLIELGFDVLDRQFRFVDIKSHLPTIKVILPPCEVDDSSSWNLRDATAQRIGLMLADEPIPAT